MDEEPVSPETIELVSALPSSRSTKYEVEDMIAQGGFAEILKVYLRENRQAGHFALKRTRHDFVRGMVTNIDCNEIRALKRLENEVNFVKIIDIVQDVYEFGIVLELCRGDIRKVLYDKNINLTLPDMKNMLKQLFTGIEAMHRLRIMHRNLKPSNILVSNTGIVKICDLGSSAVLGQRSHYSANICTMWYKSPELLFNHTKYDETTDLWSAGLIVAEFWLREPGLFKGQTHTEQMEKISQVCGFCSNEIWPGANAFPRYTEFRMFFEKYKENKLESELKKFIKDESNAVAFISKFLKLYPGERMTAAEALQDQFFTSGPEPSADLDQVINHFIEYWIFKKTYESLLVNLESLRYRGTFLQTLLKELRIDNGLSPYAKLYEFYKVVNKALLLIDAGSI